MGNFNRGDRSGGRPNFGRRDFGNRGGGNRQMFKAICSKCGKECEVPFQPSGSKPVYCSDCFREMGGPARRFDDRGSRGNSPQPQYKEQFESISAKLDKIIRLLSPEKTAPAEIVKSENTEPIKKKTRVKKSAPTDLPIEIPAE